MQNSQAKTPEVMDGVEVASGSVLATLNKSQLEVQIQTAKTYPRSIKAFRQQAMELATLDEATARSMYYVVPRSNKNIEGPSVRLAEIVGSSWGNLAYGGRVVDIGDHFVTGQGLAYDLEKNVPCTIEVRRRITDKYGKRYNDDMITVTANAAMAIALRNAIFKVVPFALVKGIYEEAKKTSLGKSLTMEQRRKAALDSFAGIKAKPADVLRVVGRKGIDDLTIEDLITLHGLRTAIAEGDTTWAEVLSGLAKDDAEVTRDLKTNLDDVADTLADTTRGGGAARSVSPADKPDQDLASPDQPPSRSDATGPLEPTVTISDDDRKDLVKQGRQMGLSAAALDDIAFTGFGADDVASLAPAQMVGFTEAMGKAAKGKK